MKELTVIVESLHNQPLAGLTQCKLQDGSMSIGRSSQNQLSLDDKKKSISRVHCRIDHQGDDFFVTDESSNGLFVNDNKAPLGQGNRQRLQHNDMLRLGPYRVRIAIVSPAQPQTDISDDEDLDEDLFEGTQFIVVDPNTLGARNTSKPGPASIPTSDTKPRVVPPDASPPTRRAPDPSRSTAAPVNARRDQDDASRDRDILEDGFGDESDANGPERATRNDPPGPPTSEPPPSTDSQPIDDFADLLGDETGDEVADVKAGAQPFGGDDLPDLSDLLPAESSGDPDPVEADGLEALDDLLDLPQEATPTDRPNTPPVTPAHQEGPQPPTPAHQHPKPSLAKPAASQPSISRLDPPSTTPSSTTPSAPITGGSTDALYRAFMEGLGLPPLPLDEQRSQALFRDLGKIFRMTTENLILMLEARSVNKEAMNLDRTMMQPTDNNLLKFPRGDLESTLALLLIPKGQGYLPPVKTFSEAFDDLNSHYTGNLSGFTAALRDLLARFEPEVLEESLNKHSRLTDMFPGTRAARYWEAYRELYQEIAEQAEENFLELIEEAFSKAYKRQQDAGLAPDDGFE